MNIVIVACLFVVAASRPQSYGEGGDTRSVEVIEILRDDRVHPEGGVYSFDFETENGITRSEAGSPLDIEYNPTGQQGAVSFTFPNGEEFNLKFVADENGFQPESDHIPVAPAFPHPIPQHALDQIAKAAREDAEAERSGGQSYQ